MIGWWAELHEIVESAQKQEAEHTAGTGQAGCHTEHAESLNAGQWARIEALLPPRAKERLMEARYPPVPQRRCPSPTSEAFPE